ncbi:MAG: 2-dehydro-3-deoxygalactonokinase [Rhizobiaceae bacterium]|nr:2-dehydro-3-deoxygalactonokinase [Rhizobiaceae bacterium]MCV0407430.1 2-dehydro-3-deoxygalactonokinase [Rhizobiaceae bacterium]
MGVVNDAAPAEPQWIAVDWGTTNLRAWAMVGDQPLATAKSARGMGTLSREEFEPVLIETIGPWLGRGQALPVVACGMVGARQGWIEVPYVSLPSPPIDIAAMRSVETRNRLISVTIVHGLSQGDPPDVMRGEETQLAGLLALEPRFEGIVCLPGTHSKWVEIRRGRVEGFRTFLTGELFDLIARQSVLRHVVDDGSAPAGPDFEQALDEIAADPAGLTGQLFSIRAGALVAGLAPRAANDRLSGLLIGMEVEASRALWASGEVTLIGQAELCALYARAILHRGGRARAVDATGCTLSGLNAVRCALCGDFA